MEITEQILQLMQATWPVEPDTSCKPLKEKTSQRTTAAAIREERNRASEPGEVTFFIYHLKDKL